MVNNFSESLPPTNNFNAAIWHGVPEYTTVSPFSKNALASEKVLIVQLGIYLDFAKTAVPEAEETYLWRILNNPQAAAPKMRHGDFPSTAPTTAEKAPPEELRLKISASLWTAAKALSARKNLRRFNAVGFIGQTVLHRPQSEQRSLSKTGYSNPSMSRLMDNAFAAHI